jgi:hypothetical protein
MRKKLVVGLVLALMLVSVVGAFAASKSQFPWMTSYNKPGHINVYAAAGLYFGGFSATGGAELILGQFDIAGIPLEWGIMAQAIIGFDGFYGGIDWGAAPLVALHWGVDWGKPWHFDWYGSVGLGIYGGSYQNAFAFLGFPAVGFGFASYEAVVWMFSTNIGLMIEYGYIGWTSVGGVGVVLKL